METVEQKASEYTLVTELQDKTHDASSFVVDSVIIWSSRYTAVELAVFTFRCNL